MTSFMKDIFAPDVRSLVKQLTSFQEEEENFQQCETYILRNLLYHRYLSVDSHAVQRSVLGVITKLMIHGHIKSSRRLDDLVHKFLKSEVFVHHPQFDVQWSLLSLLLHMANNPTSCMRLKQKSPSTEVSQVDEPDWELNSELCASLQEGKEEFQLAYDYSNNDEFSDLSDTDTSNRTEDDKEKSSAIEVYVGMEKNDVAIGSAQQFIYNAVISKEWLRDNVQHSWWNSIGHTETVYSKYSSANVAQQWDNLCSKNTNKTHTLSEYKVMREVLWMLQMPSASYIFEQQNGSFLIRTDFTIPSMTKEATKNCLAGLCEYFCMVQQLQQIRDSVEGLDSDTQTNIRSGIMPRTFQAYVAAIQDFLRECQDLCIHIEGALMKQDNIYTLYMMCLDLEPMLSKLRTVYHTHVIATYQWEESDNWLAAARLLSVLYTGVLTCPTTGHSAILLKLFLQTFQPYLDIVNTWLTSGQLDDPAGEFIIVKSPGKKNAFNDVQECDFMIHPYRDLLANKGIDCLPLLKVMESKVLHAGRNVVLLRRLNHLADVSLQHCPAGSLFTEFVETLDEQLSHFVREQNKTSGEMQEVPAEVPEVEYPSKSYALEDLELNLSKQLQQCGDPFLINVLGKYIPVLSKDDKQGPRGTKGSRPQEDVFARLSSYMLISDLPTKPVMERILTNLIEKKHTVACLVMKNIFQYEYKLSTHLALIRAVFLMEAGDIMHQFCTHLFLEADHRMLWTNSYALTTKLEDCIDLRYPEYSSRFSVDTKGGSHLMCVADAMDEITLKYIISWPLNLILTPPNMELYNAVFRFLLKVKWALWALQQLRFSDLEDRNAHSHKAGLKRKVNMLKFLRFWLLHSVGSVHTYLMGQVLHALGLELEAGVDKAKDLDTLIQVHNSYVRMVYNHCLQPMSSSVIRTAILQLVELSLNLREMWQLGVNDLPKLKLYTLRDMYFQCHCFLGTVLQNTVESGQDLHLTGLCVAINSCTLPT